MAIVFVKILHQLVGMHLDNIIPGLGSLLYVTTSCWHVARGPKHGMFNSVSQLFIARVSRYVCCWVRILDTVGQSFMFLHFCMHTSLTKLPSFPRWGALCMLAVSQFLFVLQVSHDVLLALLLVAGNVIQLFFLSLSTEAGGLSLCTWAEQHPCCCSQIWLALTGSSRDCLGL